MGDFIDWVLLETSSPVVEALKVLLTLVLLFLVSGGLILIPVFVFLTAFLWRQYKEETKDESP